MCALWGGGLEDMPLLGRAAGECPRPPPGRGLRNGGVGRRGKVVDPTVYKDTCGNVGSNVGLGRADEIP